MGVEGGAGGVGPGGLDVRRRVDGADADVADAALGEQVVAAAEGVRVVIEEVVRCSRRTSMSISSSNRAEAK